MNLDDPAYLAVARARIAIVFELSRAGDDNTRTEADRTVDKLFATDTRENNEVENVVIADQVLYFNRIWVMGRSRSLTGRNEIIDAILSALEGN